MFIGHYALGLAAKRIVPSVSLGALVLACQFADLLWPTLVLAGVESFTIRPGITAVTPLDFEYYPFSHSLLALCVWGILFGLVYRAVSGSSGRAALVLFALVLSHWVLDVVAHRPDMPLAPGVGLRIGFGLWRSIPATLAVEFLLYALGVVAYCKATVARDRVGSIGLWALVVFLAIVELASVLEPPPSSVLAVSASAQAMWLLVAWGYWVDRHRQPMVAAALSVDNSDRKGSSDQLHGY